MSSATVTVVKEAGVRIPMRDGIHLIADIWRPAIEATVPVLISRIPYDRAAAETALAPGRLAEEGFAVVVQSCRGRFGSEGEWVYNHSEVPDGYDTVEWAAAQPWSNGHVGMFGQSYGGSAQLLAAQAKPPHLDVIAPEACAADYWEGTFDSGGTFRMALRVGWTAHVISEMAEEWGIDDPQIRHLHAVTSGVLAAARAGDSAKLGEQREVARKALDQIFRMRPFRDNPLWHGRASWLDEAFEHESRDDAWWLSINPTSHYHEIDLPALHVGSWYDIHLGATLKHYTGMRRQAPTSEAREGQRLIIGPWAHWHPGDQVVGDVDFGPAAAIDITGTRAAWFRSRMQSESVAEFAPVRIFVMGENTWRDEQEWPLARTRFTPTYLHAGGVLNTEAPNVEFGMDEFVYDPRDAVPTRGGRLLGSAGEVPGPINQEGLADRSDVLSYVSEQLTENLEITGPVKVELWAATDVPDTDFTAMLLVVHPDGREINLCEGAVRARHVIPVAPLQQGAIYHYTIDLGATSVVLFPGQRLAVRISSSSFPQWEPNPNTGNPIGIDTEDDVRIARQQIYCDLRGPSRIILPIIP